MNRSQKKKLAALLGIPTSLILSRAVWAQTTYSWSGSGPDQLWTDSTNWSVVSGSGTTYPISGDSAVFNTTSANGSNVVNLGGGAQALTNMTFTNGAAAYTVGILSSGDLLNFDANATIYASSNLANTQTINANIASAGAMTITSGDMGTLAIGGNIALGGALTISGASNNAAITISGVISGSSALTLASTSNFSTNSVGLAQLNLTGQNTYSGGTSLNAPNTVIPITYTPTNTTYGVLGTGKITFNNSANQRLVPTGGNQIIYNALAPTGSGFSMQAPGPASTNNLTMAGTITFGTVGRYLSNGVLATSATDYGGDLILGFAGTAASTITLPSASAQVTHFVGIAGPTIVNDVIQNGGAFAGSIQINDQTQDTNSVVLNGANTFTGNATLGGNTAGMGVVGLGASTVGSPGAVTSGPLGTGIVIMNNTNALPIAPIGADQTIGNAIKMTSGFIVGSASASLDPTGPHSLILSGPITQSATNGRYLNNNLPAGTTLTLGLATNPSTITLGSPTVNANLSFQTQPAAGVGGGVTIVNDVIQDGGGTQSIGLLNFQLGGTIYLNAVNTWSGGLEFQGTSGATLVVSSDANMGSTSGGITFISAGTLLDTGTFTTARSINLGTNTGALGGVIDVSGGQKLTLTGGIGNTGDLTKGTNSGTLQLAHAGGGSISGNVNVTGGTLSVGTTSTYVTSTSTGNLTVTSGGMTSPFGIGGTVTITNGSRVTLNPSVPGSGVTNSMGALNIGAGSALDIGNHAVIVQNAPDETVIGGYLTNGYAGGFWNGTSGTGGSITSIVAFNDNSGDTSVGFGNSNDFAGTPSPYAPTGTNALSGNQVVVQTALTGDLLLRGQVGPEELSLLLASYGTTTYDGIHKNTWAWGNIDYSTDGLVGANDLSLLLLNYGHSTSGLVSASAKSAAAPAVSHSVKSVSTLTGTASPAVNADAIELDVYLATGDVQVNGNNATDVSALELASAGAGLVGNTTFTAAFNALFPNNASNSSTSINPYNTFAGGSTVNGLVDMGDIYNTSLNTEDLTFQFSEKNENRGGLVSGNVVYIGVPEPTTLSLLGLAAGGLLAQRRKSKNRQSDTV